MVEDIPFGPVLELVGVLVGAMSGALAAVRKQFDVFGIVVLGWAAGLGGGMLRDVLIGAVPPVGIADWRLITTAVLGAFLMYFFHPRLERARRVIVVLDAGALAVFTVVGTVKGLEYGTTAVAAVIVGVMTGAGGGVLRDVLSGEVPVVLHDRQLYAIPSMLGAIGVAVCWSVGWRTPVVLSAVVVGIFALRVLSLRFRLHAPGPWRGRPGGQAGWSP
ncbi:trimeric intracellular cation channel family protein [Cellulomonas sp. CW35]|uniref:TRIC cation channel family protein n=1 Tax=Cellulomonas sp. CW35 TaxID=3458249 RepID=UPI00227F6268